MPFDSPPAVQREMLVADLFCGAGGSSSGALDAFNELGITMKLVAVNHWPVAIETHTLNHPTARHYCTDLEAAKPREIVPEGRLDLLMASPACTYHSRARGGAPVHDQQRMDPWYVVRWLTDLRVDALMIENVPEFTEWGPCDPVTLKPIKARKGEYFRAWVSAIMALGFEVHWRIYNAADSGEATTRRRFFMTGRSDGKKLVLAEATHAPSGEMLGLSPWRATREIIDWSIPGRSIFNRKKPLAEKTLARIYAGAVKFRWPEPFLVILRNHMDAQSIDCPMPTIAAKGNHIGLATPLAAPFVLNRHGDNGSVRAHDIGEPMPTADCRGAGYLVEPFVFPMNQGKERLRGHRSIDDPLCTVTATGTDLGFVEPVVTPFVLSQASGGAPRSVEQPIPTIVAGSPGGTGGQIALISPYYGSGSGETCQTVDNPLPTATAKARFGLVVPVTNSGGGPNARNIDLPLPTMTTAKGGEFAMVIPVTHHGGDQAQSPDMPLPTITGAHRGELAFITASFGEAPGQAPRVHTIDDPTPTICAQGRVNIVQADPVKYDILFRMLDVHELAAAMGLEGYVFAGTKTEKTKQIGNAVSRRQARAIVRALMSVA